MKIQAFIADWDSKHTRAGVIQQQIHCATNIPVRILSRRNEPWAYQWEEAVSRFDGDVMLWIMADTVLRGPVETLQGSYFPALINKMKEVYSTGDVWMYAPNLDYTSQIYNTKRLKEHSPNVYEVCGTDLVFTSIHRNLLRLLPSVGVNIRGWGYDYLMTHLANTMGKKVVRDYNFMVDHPFTNCYERTDADTKMHIWIQSLPQLWRDGIYNQMQAQEKLCQP